MDLKTLARFPFLRGASNLIKEKGLSLEELVQDRTYEGARLAGRTRVLDALIKGEVQERPLGNEAVCLLEILSYPIARIIVSSVADAYMIRRYALAEARLARRRLQEEAPDVLNAIADYLGIDLRSDDGFKVHFTDYLRSTSQMRSREWKLVNQRMDRGYIILTRERLLRMLQGALQRRIEEELPLEVNDFILRSFDRDINEISSIVLERKSKFRAEDIGKIRITRFPPCMNRLLAMVQAAENVPHTGRFALVSFLHTVGLSVEEIFKVFSTVPDFDESKTRYQIEHITGRISGTEYTPPECSTMKSYGLCPGPDELCLKISHPLSYYRLKGWGARAKRDSGGKSSEPLPRGDRSL